MDLLTKIPMVVLNYNDYDTAAEFLTHFKTELAPVCELVFVDNNSNDGSYERLTKEFGHLGHFMKNTVNTGYANGNNEGLKWVYENISSSKVIVSNPDVFIKADVISKLAKALNEDTKVKLVSPVMLDNEENIQLTAWKLPGFFRETFASLFVINHIFKLDKKSYKANELDKDENIVEVVNGSFFMADMAAFYEIGFFDEDTFLYCEENILAYKLKLRGYKELLLNKEFYIHAHNATIGKIYKKKVDRYKLLCDSKRVYLSKYKRCGKLKLAFFNIISFIGRLERNIGAMLLNR